MIAKDSTNDKFYFNLVLHSTAGNWYQSNAAKKEPETGINPIKEKNAGSAEIIDGNSINLKGLFRLNLLVKKINQSRQNRNKKYLVLLFFNVTTPRNSKVAETVIPKKILHLIHR
jgi:hypothetical protein